MVSVLSVNGKGKSLYNLLKSRRRALGSSSMDLQRRSLHVHPRALGSCSSGPHAPSFPSAAAAHHNQRANVRSRCRFSRGAAHHRATARAPPPSPPADRSCATVASLSSSTSPSPPPSVPPKLSTESTQI
ncbi:hypothetical protein PVAP13_9NG233046 [Panicum virgatum]|uniref:Uncharacterized protein n=1 Tax=Panicum virgatum TaxID=38727 RepID=A0A8T0MIF5_PANVG|nr:hypothetical protein PVAP13_9NG233046 [Panicum virgatum]